MKTITAVLLLAGALVVSERPAFAQARPAEIGVGASGVVSWPSVGRDARLNVSIPFRERAAVEVFGGPYRGSRSHDFEYEINTFFGFNFRLNIDRGSRPGVQPFMTFGGVGFTGKYYYRSCPFCELKVDKAFAPPVVIGLIGGGVQYAVTQHFAVRVEGQGMVLVILPMGARFSVTAVIPLGRYASVKTSGVVSR